MSAQNFVSGPGDTLDGDATFDTDVLVVGTGPMGATTALLLATYGIRVSAVSQYSWLANSPRAHITNQRAAEVFRDAGIEPELHQAAMPWHLMASTGIVTSLAGRELARIPSWGCGNRAGDYREASPCEPMDLPQTLLEPVLVQHAATRGAKILFNTRYLGHVQDDEGVTVRLLDRVSGHEYTQRARYLVGADGGSSTVAEHLGITFTGVKGKAGTVYARFRADLSRLTAHRPGVLTLVLQSGARNGDTGTGLLRCVRPWNEWIAGWGFDPALGEPDMSDERALEQIRAFVGIDDLQVELLGTSLWYVNEQFADRMSVGRVHIGGDAAHRHPPNNGLGSNTCVQDAFNLAWKLSFVIRGEAGPDLLESYSEERQPIAQAIVGRANASRRDFAALRRVFDTQDMAFDAVVDALEAPTETGERIRAEFAQAVDVKRYEYQAHGFEMNQRYVSSAVIDDGSAEEVFTRDPDLYAQPSTRPGAKLPHAVLVDDKGNDVSTLDLVGKGAFTLLSGLTGGVWASAVESLDKSWLRSLTVDGPGARDVYRTWALVRGIPEGGALLVRPDGVIAWRCEELPASAGDACRRLSAALQAVLGLSRVESLNI